MAKPSSSGARYLPDTSWCLACQLESKLLKAGNLGLVSRGPCRQIGLCPFCWGFIFGVYGLLFGVLTPARAREANLNVSPWLNSPPNICIGGMLSHTEGPVLETTGFRPQDRKLAWIPLG